MVIPFVNDQKLIVDGRFSCTAGQFYEGLTEWNSMIFLMRYLSQNDVFFDIGANAGVYTIISSGVCSAYTHAFEPDHNAYLFLQEQIELNNLQNLVNLHRVAVGESGKMAKMSVGLDQNNHILTSDGTDTFTEVEMISIDALQEVKPVTVMKIDVEGYEFQVIDGASHTLNSDALQVVITEMMDFGDRYHFDHDGLKQKYDQAGLKLVNYSVEKNFCAYTNRWKNMNILVKDIDKVNQRLSEFNGEILIQNQYVI